MKVNVLQPPLKNQLMTAKNVRAFFKEIKLFNDLERYGFKISITQGKKGTAHAWVSIILTSKRHEQYVESIIRILIEKLLQTKFQNIASYYTDYGVNDGYAPCITIDFRSE